ncbi:uroporphyrinogen-III synthase [Sphingomonas ginkgonis]|uniref:Uroporphyrinogen-III synthase n=2 Tax=Sphingomonas ginkgonis TaxID=2315330 RepID=A0A429VDH6_9SPHN|nr:uroporphyrinogen-III synthase [Sphingomonas ginkgonis]
MARARGMGLEAIAVPLFEIQPLAAVLPAGGFDALLLTSANAARMLDGRCRELPVHAVGAATARAAEAAGYAVASRGTGGVQALLSDLPPHLRLLHPCGEDRIAVAARQPVTAIPIYRSAMLPAPPLAVLEGQVALVHSLRAGARLAELADAQQLDRGRIGVAAISPAAAAAAGPGWRRVAAAAEPADSVLLPLAARLCHDGGAG